jgi:DNA-binding response OmpR family regulator
LPEILHVADLVVDRIRRKVARLGQGLDLTRTEFALLERLVLSSPRVASREALIEGIWGGQNEVTPGALDVLVNSLRSKIDTPFPRKLLHTVRGAGYVLKVEEDVEEGPLMEGQIQ